MSVPFEQVGPGQLARTVIQVIGKDGPILNPTNIRYLPVDQGEASAITDAPNLLAPAASVALSSVNLVAGVANLAVSVAVLREVQQLSRKLDAMAFQLQRMDSKLDVIQEHVKRIDIRVAEGHLRQAIQHVLQRAVGPDGIDFAEIGRLSTDIQNLEESLDEPLLLSHGIHLSTDVHDQLEMLLSPLYFMRRYLVSQYNHRVVDDPSAVVRFDPEREYLGDLDAVPATAEFVCSLDLMSWVDRVKILWDIDTDFSFSDEDDLKKFNKNQMDRFAEVWAAVENLPQGEAAMRALKVASPSFNRLREFRSKHAEIAIGAAEADEATRLFKAGIDAGEGLDEDFEKLPDIMRRWLYGTDGGLLWRLKKELEGVRNGYVETFYPQLRGTANMGVTEFTERLQFDLAQLQAAKG